jgi:solute carrier family 10 (sodium/bile acid cotransporter), member 7
MKKIEIGSGPPTPVLKDARISKPGSSTGLFRGNGFLLGLCAAVGFGFLFPQAGARNGALHPEIVGDGGIALIMFLQGLSIALDKMRAGAANWRLHATIQVFTFVVFPLVGLAFGALLPWIWPNEPEPIREGLLGLIRLPDDRWVRF